MQITSFANWPAREIDPANDRRALKAWHEVLADAARQGQDDLPDTFTVHGKTKACLAHPYLWLAAVAAVVVWGVMLVGKA